MLKARVLVEGNVQGVGYRALVKQVARRMKIKGKVKNLDDGTIELYSEADRDAIEKFLNAIDKRSRDPDDIFSLNVEKISVCYEGENGYVPPDKEPGIFEIDYEEEAVTAFEKSNLERLEIGTLILSDVSGKQDQTINTLTDFKNETKESFDDLGEKYHLISEELISINKNVARTHKDIAKSNKNIAKLTEYIAVLVEDHVKKR